MKLIIFMSCLHVAVLVQGGNISCKIPAVEPMAETYLTCTFPEDISLSKKDFSVVHTNNTSRPVLDCLWAGGNLECFEKPGYTFNRTVTNQLTIVIPQAFSNMTGDYYCKVSDSTNFNIQHCQLAFRPESNDYGSDINTKADTEEGNGSLAIGLGVGLVCLTAIAIAVFIFILKRKKGNAEAAENEPFIKLRIDVDASDAAQETFEGYLKKTVLEMYPNKSESFYFVPPVYFNRRGYENKSQASEDIYVPKSTDENVVEHDRAMQHFLHCLRQMAEQGEEQMFVLTQFKYEDYLTSTIAEYKQHSLPMPADLTEEDVNVECFDFLIVHRHHGVLVGVVIAVCDNDMKKVNEKKKTTEEVVDAVDKAIKQLKKAENMIKHLMSEDTLPRIRQTLILPNLSSTSLRHATASTKLVESLRERMGLDSYGEPIKQCLCSDHLSDPKTPWEVKPKVVKNMEKWWNLVMTTQDGETRMNDDLYDDMIARFFGPATQSKLKLKDDREDILPKILSEAVSLTGDLYSSTMLDEDPKSLLNHPISFLVGPPNTGKTRKLTLAGRKWLSEGHDVFIVKDKTSKSDPFLSQHLKKSIDKMDVEPTDESLHDRIYNEKCDLRSKTSIKECVHTIIDKHTRKGKDKICILLDVAHLKGTHVNNFNETLHQMVSTPYFLWVSCSSDMRPKKGYVLECQQILNCPPAVIREAQKLNNEKKKDESHAHDSLSPTDGPPVKHIYYKLPLVLPQESRELGRMVGDFLAKDLLVTRTDGPAWKKAQAVPLTHKDIFILFESNAVISEDCEFLAGLRDNNIMVHAVKIEDETVVVDEADNTAWAMNVCNMRLYRMKRKIIVYVQSYFKDEENKQRAITSCTSQLILVQPNRMFCRKSSTCNNNTRSEV